MLGSSMRCALHLAPVGLSHRNRDAVERRFQNPGPGHPVTHPIGALPLLIGVWKESGTTVLVGAPVTAHRMTAQTRQSLFVPLQTLLTAKTSGWSEHVNGAGETFVAFLPQLLPVYVAALVNEVSLSPTSMQSVAEASGLAATPTDLEAASRARVASTRLVRDESFSKKVLTAYRGFCALCGLDFGLVEGAHVLPVHVSGSTDAVSNGIALCANHHRAFDRHLVWITPSPPYEVSLHPNLLCEATQNPACRAFVDGTLAAIRTPSVNSDCPSPRMFERRYEVFRENLDWAI